jgi:alanyl-tRNA synthetase
MFTNAGMNQFKDLFLGNAPVQHARICNSQKCLRVSGKHNDLEEVGVDTYHHTMFEMLGNWSFGDYFKKEAIEWAWEFLTEVCGVNKDIIYVTVFEGDKGDDLSMDQEAYDFWKKIVPEERILMGNKKDNFWEMGKTGPCGPCSEIHVDIRPESEKAKVPGDQLVNHDHPQVIEVWNLVFMEFNRMADGSLVKLPAQHVDTGMGFERLAMVLQSKTSNYDTDVFTPLIQFLEKKSGIQYGAKEETDIALRVMSDHVRAVSFAIADGQMLSNNGAGYVIRRILRRAVRYAFSKLELKTPVIHEMVEILDQQMGDFFPEIRSQKQLITKVIKEEESNFLRTLEKGILRFQEYADKASDKNISGEAAFELYDTFGFPIDLTQLLAKEQGFEVDMKGFKSALAEQKDRSRQAAVLETDDWVKVKDGEGSFVGYDQLEVETEVLRYREVQDKGKTYYQVELKESPFYPEGGGQVGDEGLLIFDDEKIPVFTTRKENGLILLSAKKLPSNISVSVIAKVHAGKRLTTASNHTATHLLHAALREVLGGHVEQKGSLVNAEYLRFDFSHFQKVTDEELSKIESIVRDEVRKNLPLQEDRTATLEEAKSKGAMALFGEKYGDKVRVVQFGSSIELCGGTHVPATGNIGGFVVVSESAVASGVRRIEALTGLAAEKFLDEQRTLLNAVKDALKNPKDLLKQVESLQNENAQLSKQIEQFEKEKAKVVKQQLVKDIEEINGAQCLIQRIDIPSSDAIKDISFQLKQQYPKLFMVLGAEIKGKPNLTVAIGDELIKEKSLNAGQIIRDLAKEIKGGGGGQPFFATAGGNDLNGLDIALERAKGILK